MDSGAMNAAALFVDSTSQGSNLGLLSVDVNSEAGSGAKGLFPFL